MLRLGLLTGTALALVALALHGRGHTPHATASALAAALTVDKCTEVEVGDTFTVAVSVAGVTNLLAWDIYYAYDRKIVEVVDKDVRMFLDRNPSSNVFDFSDPVPDTDGVYHVGAADTGGAGTEENGGGVLVSLTLKARAKGLSWSSLIRLDQDGDGAIDLGPTLTATGGSHISDSNGDGIFDGPISNGQIAVGRTCKDPAPTPSVEDVIVVAPGVSTPTLTTPTATPLPDGSTPAPASPRDTTPRPSGPGASVPRRSPTPTSRTAVSVGGGDSGGGPSPFLAALIGAAGGAGIVASYLIYKAVRRPA